MEIISLVGNILWYHDYSLGDGQMDALLVTWLVDTMMKSHLNWDFSMID
jgi:hypothetical protein